jgi:hypothetical protein
VKAGVGNTHTQQLLSTGVAFIVKKVLDFGNEKRLRQIMGNDKFSSALNRAIAHDLDK